MQNKNDESSAEESTSRDSGSSEKVADDSADSSKSVSTEDSVEVEAESSSEDENVEKKTVRVKEEVDEEQAAEEVDQEESSCDSSTEEKSSGESEEKDEDSEQSKKEDKKGRASSERGKNDKQREKSGQSSATVFVKGFGKDVTELMVEEEFGKIGKVVNVRMPKDRQTSENKGFCFVEFSGAASAKKALGLSGKTVFDSKLIVNPGERGSSTSIFISNLPYTATKEDIKEVFKKYKISDIRVPMEDEERNKGFCFVDFSSESDSRKVLEGQFEVDNRRIFLKESHERKDRGGERFDRDKKWNDRGSKRNFDGDRKFNRDDRGLDRNDRRRGGFRDNNGGSDRNDRGRGGFKDKNRGFDKNDRGRGGFKEKRFKENDQNKKIVFDDSSE